MEDNKESIKLLRKAEIDNIEKVLEQKFSITSLKDIYIPSQDLQFRNLYKIIALLGIGAFGVVLEVRNKVTQEISALKISSQQNSQLHQMMRNELSVMQELQHPNIIKFKQILFSNEFVFIEMEKMNGGTLQQLINQLKECKQKHLDEESTAYIMKSIFAGLTQIHEKNFIHRDLKPDNILLNKEIIRKTGRIQYTAKIADFGLSAEYKFSVFSGQVNINEKMGTILYMAPEQAQGQRYGKRIDIWACGVIMYTMLTGEHPFFREGDNEKTYINRISNQELDYQYPLPKLGQSLFWRLCSRSVTERYSANQAIKHPWITRNLQDEIPLTQGEEVRVIEAETSLRKVQSVMLFMSIQTLQGFYDCQGFKSLSPTYMQKIEMGNKGLFNDLLDLTISPQSSSTDNNPYSSTHKGLSDNDTFLDKTSQSKYDESFALHDTSESHNVSKNTTISHSLFSKQQRNRPPAIQISKKQINLEPKSAFINGDGMRKTTTLHQPQSSTNKSNNTTEETQELSPLTSHHQQKIKIKIPRTQTIMQDSEQKYFQNSNRVPIQSDSPMVRTPFMNKRATSSMKDSHSNYTSYQSQQSGSKNHAQLPDPNTNKKVDLMITKKISMHKSKGGNIHPKLQSQINKQAQDSLLKSGSSVINMIMQQGETRLKHPNNIKQRSLAHISQDQNVKPLQFKTQPASKKVSMQNIDSEIIPRELKIDTQTVHNSYSITKKLIEETKIEAMKQQNQKNRKRASMGGVQDFIIQNQKLYQLDDTPTSAQQTFQQRSGSGTVANFQMGGSPALKKGQHMFSFNDRKSFKLNKGSNPVSPMIMSQKDLHTNLNFHSSVQQQQRASISLAEQLMQQINLLGSGQQQSFVIQQSPQPPVVHNDSKLLPQITGKKLQP